MTTDESRFYYLRLMAKPGSSSTGRSTKPKFVQWGPARPFSTSLEDDPDLESQAMRIVRTIGQAFEVCHKVAKQQAQDQALAESREEEIKMKEKEALIETVEEAATEEAKELSVSKSPSPVIPLIPPPAEPPPPAPSAAKPTDKQRQSVDQSFSSFATAGTTVKEGGESESQISGLGPLPNPNNPLSAHSNQPPNPPQGGSYPPFQPLPSSQTWSAGQQTGLPGFPGSSAYSSLHRDSSDQYSNLSGRVGNVQEGLMPFSTSFPQALAPASPQQAQSLVSPYATLHLPAITPYSIGTVGGPGANQNPSQSNPGHGIPPAAPMSPTATPNTAQSLSRQLDHYSMSLFRNQLEQAQQQAQVACCQVQLLRDQLSAETTARLEAQIPGGGLPMHLSFQEGLNTIGTATAVGPNLYAPMPPVSQLQQFIPRPGVLPTIEDLRGGSMPPRMEGPKKKKQSTKTEILPTGGVLVEPGSTTTTDTTDYSSSDQAASEYATRPNVAGPIRPTEVGGGPELNVFMVNPRTPTSLQNWEIHYLLQQQQRNLALTQQELEKAQQAEEMVKEEEERKPSISDQQEEGASPPKDTKDKGKILHGESSFKRMSFNAPLKKEVEKPQSMQDTIAEETEEESVSKGVVASRSNSVISVKESPYSIAGRQATPLSPQSPPKRLSETGKRRSFSASRHMSIDTSALHSGPLVNGPVMNPGQWSARSSTSTASELTPPSENHISEASSIDSNTFAAQLALREESDVANDIAALHSALLGCVNPRQSLGNPDKKLSSPAVLQKLTKNMQMSPLPEVKNMHILSEQESALRHNGLR